MISEYQPTQRAEWSIKERLLCLAWYICNRTLYRFSFGFMRGYRRFLLRRFGANIAYDASLHRLAEITCPWNLSMASKASIGELSWIYALAKIEIGANSCIGREVRIITGSHDITSPTFLLKTNPIRIGAAVWVANGSYVLPGINIGDGAVIAAHSTVTRDVEPWTVVGGNPAKFIKKRELKA